MRVRLRAIGILVVGINLLICTRLSAFEASTRAPFEYCLGSSCADDISLQAVVESWSKRQKAQTECLSEKAKRLEKNEFSFVVGSDCSATPILFRHSCQKTEPTSGQYYWAPAVSFTDGDKLTTNVIDLVKTGRIINGSLMLVETSNSKADEQHIALCRVQKIADAVGPPKSCATVAIRTPTTLWVRGDNSSGFCEASATFRLNGAISIEFNVTTKRGITEFSKRIKDQMTSDLGLSVESRDVVNSLGEIESVSVLSVAPLRDSKIIKGWRESFGFDLNLYLKEGRIQIIGSAQPLICQQALGSLKDYRGLDDVQRGLYASTLDKFVEQSVSSVCSKFKKNDAKELSCD
jgi:hypothetical protein